MTTRSSRWERREPSWLMAGVWLVMRMASAPRLVQVRIEGPSHLLREARHALELLARGAQHRLGRAEVLEQRALARGPDAREVVHDRFRHGLVPADPVVGDGESVGLVAYSLEELELRRVVREHDGLGLPGEEHLLDPLGQRYDRDAALAEALE